MVIFLAARKGVPQDLYEAAFIDGAGKWRQFFTVIAFLSQKYWVFYSDEEGK